MSRIQNTPSKINPHQIWISWYFLHCFKFLKLFAVQIDSYQFSMNILLKISWMWISLYNLVLEIPYYIVWYYDVVNWSLNSNESEIRITPVKIRLRFFFKKVPKRQCFRIAVHFSKKSYHSVRSSISEDEKFCCCFFRFCF